MLLYTHLYPPLLFSAAIVRAGYVVARVLNCDGIDPGRRTPEFDHCVRANACPSLFFVMKRASFCASIDPGGGKRRRETIAETAPGVLSGTMATGTAPAPTAVSGTAR